MLVAQEPNYPLGESVHPGGELMYSGGAPVGHAVLENDFDEWGEVLFVSSSGAFSTMRKPVGRLDRIEEPLYDVKVGGGG